MISLLVLKENMKSIIYPIKKHVDSLSLSKETRNNFFIAIIPQLISFFCGFITSILIARGLGPEGFGKYGLLMSVPISIGQLSDMGIGQTSIRFGSKAHSLNEEDLKFSVFRWAFRIRFLISIILLILFFLLSHLISFNFWHTDESFNYLFKISLILLITNVLSSIPIFYFQAITNFSAYSKIASMQKIFNLVGILLVAYFHWWSLSSVIYVTILSSLFIAIIYLSSVPLKTLYLKGETNFNFLRKKYFLINDSGKHLFAQDSTSIGSFISLMTVSNIIVALIMNADVWIMGVLLGKNQIGLYSAAFRFTIPYMILLSSVQTILWPYVAKNTEKHQIKLMMTKVFKISMVFFIGGLIYALFVPRLAPTLFGIKYFDSIKIGQLLCLRYCLSLIINPLHMMGYNFGLVKIYWLINLIQLIFVVLVNVLLLPLYGPIGAAIALIVNELIGFFLILPLILRKMNKISII
jgi:O-antigen/teichoic acid export membrane protein